MKLKTSLSLIATLYCLGAFAEEAAPEGAYDNPIIIYADKLNPNVDEREQQEYNLSKLHFRIVNVKPNQRDLYRYSSSLSSPQILPLPQQQTSDASSNKGANNQAQNAALIKAACDKALQPIINELNNDKTTNSQINSILDKMKLITGCVDQKNSIIDSTQIMFSASNITSKNLSVKVTFLENNIPKPVATFEFKGDKQQWVTHTGWTFIHSKDSEYYSLKGEDDTFSIERKNSQKSVNHALTMMYTYPMGYVFTETFGDKVSWGPSGLLGLGQNGLLVGTGASLIFAENIALNFSVVATEFEKLNGVYTPGQNIGAQALDSSSLNEKKIMASWAITIGFKFN